MWRFHVHGGETTRLRGESEDGGMGCVTRGGVYKGVGFVLFFFFFFIGKLGLFRANGASRGA